MINGELIVDNFAGGANTNPVPFRDSTRRSKRADD